MSPHSQSVQLLPILLLWRWLSPRHFQLLASPGRRPGQTIGFSFTAGILLDSQFSIASLLASFQPSSLDSVHSIPSSLIWNQLPVYVASSSSFQCFKHAVHHRSDFSHKYLRSILFLLTPCSFIKTDFPHISRDC